MIIIWGTRNGGKVDQRDGQYALTRFAHVYYLPLFPVGSVWVTREGMGHDMKMSGKSVLAGYVRAWGLVFAGAGLITMGGIAGVLAAVAGIAASAGSWLWGDVHGDTAKRKSDLNLLAFGTRCEPKRLPNDLVSVLHHEANERWARVANGQSPSDVARFGTDDVTRAAAAYGVLRLSALSLPRAQASEAETDAERIATGLRDKLQLTEGGPYRSTMVGAPPCVEQPSDPR